MRKHVFRGNTDRFGEISRTDNEHTRGMPMINRGVMLLDFELLSIVDGRTEPVKACGHAEKKTDESKRVDEID